MMPSTFDVILILCGIAGIVMVVGSIALLYQGVIKLSEKSAGTALEAEFKNQLKVNVRNPALGLFAIGFSFFVLALYFAKPKDEGPLVISGNIKGITDEGSILVRLKSEEWPMQVSSDGKIFATVQPLEKLAILIEAPGYRPPRWYRPLLPEEAKRGRIEIAIPEFKAASGTLLVNPKLEKLPQPPLDTR